MFTNKQIREYIEEIVNQEGFELYDIEYPSSSVSGVIRVYIFSSSKTVTVSDCATISRRIANLPEYEEIVPGNVTLEISSPGINRSLKTKEHLKGAISERVKVKLKSAIENKKSFLGILKNFNGELLTIFDESLKKEVQIEYDNIASARIDFDFNS